MAERALADVERALSADGNTVAKLGYHGADCDADALADAIETPSLFGARTLVVLRGAEALPERAHERLALALERQAPQITVAIIARGADMRRRLFARCRELAERIAVDHPRVADLRGWAERFARERGRRLDDDAVALLIETVGRDLMVLASEVDKLAAAVTEGRAITATDVRRVAAAAREHGNFEMVDALCARDASGAVRLLRHALDEGAQPIAIVGAIAASLRPLLAGAELLRRGRGAAEAERVVGVAPYQRRGFQHGLRAYAAVELRRALTRLVDLDVALKTGAGEPRALLEDWVLRLCLRRSDTRSRAGATV